MSRPHHQSRIHLVRNPALPKASHSFEPMFDTSEEFVQIPFDFDSLPDEEEDDRA
jgi:hypothetical protein